MKIAFVGFVLIHGLIHLMGFIKAFDIAQIEALSKSVSKTSGLMWLMSCLLFSSFAIMIWSDYSRAHWFGFLAVTLSQVLVFMHWNDAKWGSGANLIILIGVILICGQNNFNGQVRSELDSLKQIAPTVEGQVIKKEDLDTLPVPVRNWLEQSGAVGRPAVKDVCINQKLRLRMNESDEGWKNASAIQYSFKDPPAFHWTLDMKMSPWSFVVGRDMYVNGKGNMLIKLYGLFKVADASGPKIDEATLQRYLSEIVWMPSFALNGHISWEDIDEHSAKATMTYKGVHGSGIFRFARDGSFIEFSTDRFKDSGPGAKRLPWVIAVEQNRTFQGIKIPSEVNVSWVLNETKWTWLEVKVENVHYSY